jgi:hypothetical protein
MKTRKHLPIARTDGTNGELYRLASVWIVSSLNLSPGNGGQEVIVSFPPGGFPCNKFSVVAIQMISRFRLYLVESTGRAKAARQLAMSVKTLSNRVDASRADHPLSSPSRKPVRLLCRVLTVSVSGFHAYLHRQGRPNPETALRVELHTIHADSRGTCGRPRLVQALRVAPAPWVTNAWPD